MCFENNAENPREFLADHFSKSLADENKLLRDEIKEMKKNSTNITFQASSQSQPVQPNKFGILRNEIKETVIPKSIVQPKKRGRRPKKCLDETKTSNF